MEAYFKEEFQWGIIKFGPANIQDLASHFLIIFSIGLILYFAIFIDEQSQPIINKADRGEEPTPVVPSTNVQLVLEPKSPDAPDAPTSPAVHQNVASPIVKDGE